MTDPIPLHITTFFLLLQSVVWFESAWKSLGLGRESLYVSPARFLLVTFFSFIFMIVGLYFLGFQFLALAVVIAFSLTLSLVHPLSAVCILISYLILRPWELGIDNPLLSALPRLSAFLAVASWLLYAIRTRSLRFVWNDSCTLIFALFVWLLITTIVKGDIDNTAKLVSGFTPQIVLFFLVINIPISMEDLSYVVKSLLLGIVGVMAVALYVTFHNQGLGSDARLYGMGIMGNANDLAAAIVLALPFALFPVLRKGQLSIFKPGVLFTVLTLLLALWYSQSRGALVALSVAFLIYILMDLRSARGIIFTSFFAVLVPAFVIYGMSRSESDLSISEESRWGYLIAGLRMFRHNPIFGVGVYNYPKFYDRYGVVFYEWGEQTAHSSWILALAEAGFIGFFIFVYFYFSAVWRSLKIRRIRPEFFYALIAYGVAISFLSHTYMLFPYLLVAICVCACRAVNDQSKSEAKSST